MPAPPRLHVEIPLRQHEEFVLPAGAARHVQVLRLQPGDAITLFDGRGGEHEAEVLRMGRSEVAVQVGARHEVDRELAVAVTLAVGMPANDRMDALVEKATELGATAIQPLLCERSVLRLAGERADKRRAHWQGIAVAAAEQSGRTRVTEIAPVLPLAGWLPSLPADGGARWLLGFGEGTRALPAAPRADRVVVLSGPEGGLAAAEVAMAADAGFVGISLGPRVLRADTAPLAVLGWLGAALA